MKRFDLRHLRDNYETRMQEIMQDLQNEQVCIFLFEIGDFSSVQNSADLAKQNSCDLLNSLKFNEVDWTITVRKVQ